MDADDIGTGGEGFVDEIVVEGVGNFVDDLDGVDNFVKSSDDSVFGAVRGAVLTNNFSDDIFCKGGGFGGGGGDGEGGAGDIVGDDDKGFVDLVVAAGFGEGGDGVDAEDDAGALGMGVAGEAFG
ncbi:hypothetical protein AGMMS49593_06710 [Endomicrobiia bacterium]|nr:hypothetical protein AGMMS49593_06710 [Endomicrobiia bacterium]